MVVPYALLSSRRWRYEACSWPPPSSTGIEQQVGPQESVVAVPDEKMTAPERKEHFLSLLQRAELRHQETVQRVVQAEMQVEQMRQLFQQWQAGLEEQRQQQLQVHKQMQALHVSLNQQELRVSDQLRALDAALRARADRQQLQVQYQLEELYAMQQMQAAAQQQQLGQLQSKVSSLVRVQRAERRRQPTRRVAPAPRPAPVPWGPPAVCSEPNCCCPCENPETCPLNPVFPSYDCCETQETVSDTPSSNCFLRDMRLGLVEQSCTGCIVGSTIPTRRTRDQIKVCKESDAGYIGDDEASLYSDVSSVISSSFKEERRLILQEVRNLKNTSLVPRYRQIWEPLRCFRCGRTDHLATFCDTEQQVAL